MFYGTGITETTDIKLLRPSGNACNAMFKNCTNLNKVTVRFEEIPYTNAITNWLENVAASGTLYCPHDLVLPSGTSGLPTGWTREDI